ncbi:CENP-B homolog protein 2-like [Rhizophagus irregularis DAOM 181602=DAOM 197198]|nr:CENP-B homolog protein 2-like [Rhizophagus irregularis DAOM 181602=DAOM 197198]
MKYPNTKWHKPVTYPEVKLALKEFVLNYQHQTVLNALQFSSEWLYKFKNCNRICQQKLEEEASSANEVIIANALSLLKELYSNYPPKRIYNINKTGLFYRLESNQTLAIK